MNYLIGSIDIEKEHILHVNPWHIVQKHSIEWHVQVCYLCLFCLKNKRYNIFLKKLTNIY